MWRSQAAAPGGLRPNCDTGVATGELQVQIGLGQQNVDFCRWKGTGWPSCSQATSVSCTPTDSGAAPDARLGCTSHQSGCPFHSVEGAWLCSLFWVLRKASPCLQSLPVAPGRQKCIMGRRFSRPCWSLDPWSLPWDTSNAWRCMWLSPQGEWNCHSANTLQCPGSPATENCPTPDVTGPLRTPSCTFTCAKWACES